MTAVHFHGPPVLASQDGSCEWCLMCLMIVKGQQLDDPRLAELAKDGKDKQQYWVPWPKDAKLNLAVVKGLCDLGQLGLVPVCWDHFCGYRIQIVSPLDTNTKLPPGLIRGSG